MSALLVWTIILILILNLRVSICNFNASWWLSYTFFPSLIKIFVYSYKCTCFLWSSHYAHVFFFFFLNSLKNFESNYFICPTPLYFLYGYNNGNALWVMFPIPKLFNIMLWWNINITKVFVFFFLPQKRRFTRVSRC